ncbi:hypothetical protein LQZ18_16985 [Lachnospiraceae bacterium ZAX-1]
MKRITQDGERFEFISKGIGLFEFIYTMIGTANFFFLFILVVIGSMVMAREVECKEIDLYVYRIAKRIKIIVSKAGAMQVVITLYYLIIIALSTAVYLRSADVAKYGIWSIVDADINKYIVTIVAVYLGTTVISIFCIFVGVWQKAFATFSIVFILYIISMYFDNFKFMRNYFPEHFAHNLVVNGLYNSLTIVFYFSVYVAYIVIWMVLSSISFAKKEFQ